MSCDGYRYTLLLNTRAVGSAVNWSRMIGFCAMTAETVKHKPKVDNSFFVIHLSFLQGLQD